MKFKYKSKLFNIEGIEGDHVYRSIVQSKTFYEIDLLEYIYGLRSFINSKEYYNISIDVGANIGNHSIFFGFFVSDEVIAIEPNPDILPMLRRNLSENIDNYTLYDCALGEKEDKGKIVLPKKDNIASARIDLQKNGNIEIETLDFIFPYWYENNIHLSLIKIDVEGMELDVLKGAKSMILKYKPHFFVEAKTKEDCRNIYNFLRPLGYRIIPGHWASTPVYHFAHKPTFALYVMSYFLKLKSIGTGWHV